MNELKEFADSWFLWREPLFIGALSGAICGFTGVYVILRRMVFVSATLTQISSLGVVIAFYINSVAAGTFLGATNPFYITVMLTCVAAVFFSLKRDFFPVTLEGVIGLGFLLAWSLAITIGDRITQGQHEIDNILFGSAVVVDRTDILLIPTVTVLAFILHKLLYKEFVFVSFDPELAKLYGYPVRIINILLFIILGAVAASATRALGALPVFGLLAIPALTSLYLTEKLNYVFIFSSVIGTLSATLGYFISFVFSIPTGASMVLCSCVLFTVGVLINRLKKTGANVSA